MDPTEAVLAHLELDATISVAMHFGTFQLTTEGSTNPRVRCAARVTTRASPIQRFAYRSSVN